MINTLYTVAHVITCLLIGYVIQHSVGGLPASLYGMILFTLLLHFKICNADKVKQCVTWGIRHMGVCFVPAGVGIINHFQLIKQHGITIVVITFLTTLLVLTIVGCSFQSIENRNE